MTNRTWKTKLSLSVPMTFAALLNPALAQAGNWGGWDCISADQKVYLNFMEPKLGGTGLKHQVLEVGGYDGDYYHKETLRDFRTEGEVNETHFKVKLVHMTTQWRTYEAMGLLEGTKDANGQWHVTYTSWHPLVKDPKPVPLSCKF